jgi:hypothetical protein
MSACECSHVEEIEDINDAIEEFTEIQPEHCHRITVLNGSEEDVEECSVIYVGSDSEEELCFPGRITLIQIRRSR